MNTQQIVEKLIYASRFNYSSKYSLFSYRDYNWELISISENPKEIAKEYTEHCWGQSQCLEIRCNGIRVEI